MDIKVEKKSSEPKSNLDAKSECWVCNRLMKKENVVLGDTCKRILFKAIDRCGFAEDKTKELKDLATKDPNAFKTQCDAGPLKDEWEKVRVEVAEKAEESREEAAAEEELVGDSSTDGDLTDSGDEADEWSDGQTTTDDDDVSYVSSEG